MLGLTCLHCAIMLLLNVYYAAIMLLLICNDIMLLLCCCYAAVMLLLCCSYCLLGSYLLGTTLIGPPRPTFTTTIFRLVGPPYIHTMVPALLCITVPIVCTIGVYGKLERLGLFLLKIAAPSSI